MSENPATHVLARKDGLELVLTLLFVAGAACPKCGYGTRVTSKRWARCKRPGCDGRARRRTMEEAAELVRQATANAQETGA